jgi:intracellular sulfur oxidation DsrE/DsrF family protein
MKFKFLALLGALTAIFISPTTPSLAKEPVKVALQISDNTAEKMNATLNVAANLSRYYSEKGEEIQIEIVAYIAGLHMLREDTSPVKARLKSFKQSMPNVVFRACKNTLDVMAKNEGKVPPLVENAQIVPAGVVKLIELSKEGYTIIRP